MNLLARRIIPAKCLLLAIVLTFAYHCILLLVFPPFTNQDFHVAELINNNTTFDCSPSIPLQQLETYIPTLNHTNNSINTIIWKGPGLIARPSNQATCFFFETPQSKHFPHAMQQLYRCWSYWNLHPELSPVLIGPAHHRGFRPTVRHDFFTNMLQALQTAIALRVESMNYTTTTELDKIMESLAQQQQQQLVAVRSNFEHGDGFAFASSRDTISLQKVLLQQQSGCPIDRQPRIAILNRDQRYSKRSFLNANELAREITSRGLSTHVPIVYFENATFQEQIQFFHQFDIVLSPHGAQLTSMPFMPSCGGVLEFFPRGYFMPFYFGSLARASGLHYMALYVSENDWEAETTLATKTVHSRFRARQSNLCPLVVDAVQAVTDMVGHWNQCCSRVGRS